MKKSVLIMIMAAVALISGATDRFYIEDFSIAPGETRTVSILLDNATEYTAFQCDIYMPEGLTVEQDDGDYIFDLTGRKSRDHNIASQLQTNGAIRVMSYSPKINAYSGTSGALVTFEVTASDDFAGTLTIGMRNILFTTMAGREVAFADEVCNVTVPSSGLMGDVDGDGVLTIGDVVDVIDYLLGITNEGFIIDVADVDGDGVITIGDVVDMIDALLAP